MAVTTTTQVDPTIQPFLSYGLTEAQRLYQAGGPQYYQGQTYVSPSQATQTGLQALEQRAQQGNPLLGMAQTAIQGAIQGQQSPAAQMYSDIYANAGYNPAMAGTQATASGQFLGGNPFFQGAFEPAARAATQQFQTAMGDIGSAASKAGRYGSGAMGTLQDRASGQLAKSLSDTAGQLAYQNYAQERGLQESAQSRLSSMAQQEAATRLAATGGLGGTYASDLARQMSAASMAPQIAQADYQDIQNLLAAGQAREGYTGQQLAADMARFNFGQNAPQQNLSTFLSSVYGSPMANLRSQTQTGAADTSTMQNVLGTAATFGGLYKNLGGSTGINNLWNTGSNWLNGLGSSGANPAGYGTGADADLFWNVG